MGSMFFTFVSWAFVAWLGTGMWLVLTGRAGYHVEMNDEGEECPLIISLFLDGLAALLSPWWMLVDHITGDPYE